MKRFRDLTVTQQANAVKYARVSLALPPELDDDPTLQDRLNKVAKDRAQEVWYAEPGDKIISAQQMETDTTQGTVT